MKKLNEYVDSVQAKHPFELHLSQFYYDLESKVINDKMFNAAIDELVRRDKVEREKNTNDATNTNNTTTAYLQTLSEQATPDALKQAKKSIKPFIEQLIYKDLKAARIDAEKAKEANRLLVQFLSIHKLDVNNDVSG